MSYLWDVGIKLKNQDYKLSEITFKQAQNFSPYMECSFEDINTLVGKNETITEVEVNALYRFLEIFAYMLDVNYEEYEDSKNALFDILMYYLLELDLHQGYCIREYCKKFFEEDLEKGSFGDEVADGYKYFSVIEKDIILDSIYNIYSGASGLYFFNVILGNIFSNSIAYINKETEYGLFIYVGEKYSIENYKKLNVIISLFLPIKFIAYICWDKHFPILGVEKTMCIENNVLF